ncbi:MAG: 1-(5-phosphoribosyl)-5-[(5-phosphoribosylamino)methylideneamino]imidazole-4-carboxamide isomerase [Acidobacteria bacterium]|nr:1-(5-phosphoribosyl)-5-[(5-phosphoribosylamino)methylideneamino]imidazole-4-carboxamide isomerase [Acidobacteriota bacterium]MCI0624529.1 1-(5-phosphoribosyl)-5-[(5-phosphoribosylamino)methylideneamino]imidazole-4-carboxamide isomerase [Acidobacteriota bacterium]MCI0720668.1 1-(5-phosphoribosyl)-5-[(5-phosphoribosylamino)methylideneamino]imidazole-4-carboxamide isomerase [Acidobacteriota bacterium]
MIIFPAIDMRQGKCVRLLQGRADQETIYFEDPAAVAQRWEAEGAGWLHLVDLDGAMSASSGNRVIAKKIFSVLRIPVQFGGGIRAMTDLEEVLDAGAARVVVGTAAVQHPEFLAEAIQRFSERIVVGIDARDGRVATHGWNQVGSLEAVAFAKTLARRGVRRVVYTDISKDGMLVGPNVEATRRLAGESQLKVIASGGVASLEHLRSLRALESLGIEGAIVGKALYERRFTLQEAIEAGGA